MMRPKYMFLLFALSVCSAQASDYFVAGDGNDANPGSLERPFLTIQKAADILQPGDTCFVRGGTYREAVEIRKSGKPDAPVRFAAFPGEVVVLDGTETIRGPWSAHQGKVYKTETRQRFEQLFVDRKMMLEARWPNTTFDGLFTRKGWATTGPKSAYLKLHDPELAKTGIDWSGATAMLNIAHQFWTWSRPVLNHSKGSDTFEYEIEMNEFHSKRTHWWADDSYYLMGKLEALDSPSEWFLSQEGTLYLWPPEDENPTQLKVEAKARDYAFRGKEIQFVEITGFHFFACTFTLEDAEHCRVEHCNLLFPSFARGVPDAEKPRRICAGTRVTGKDNVVRNCSLAYCATFGIQARGQRNSIENCLIHDVNWSGTLRYTGISLSGNRNDEGPANAARYNTVYNVGNTIINSGGNRHGIIEYNHVHHGGMLSKDVSLIYTSMHYAMGNEIRYNWVHDSLSPSNSLGIRGDDKTRGLRIHHNVVWNVRRDGVVIKGGKNRVYNNTCFANGASDILFLSGREPDKWWQKHVKAYAHQNEDSLLINNCANVIVSTRRKRDPGLPGDHSNNDTSGAPQLAAPGKLDFRPGPDSPLVDAGRTVEGVTAPFVGKAPDVGAYEFGGDHWLPGHRNGITLSRSAAGGLQGSLWMPVLEPVSLKIIKGEQAIGEPTFTPGNWMEAQPIDLGATSPDENPQAIRFESGDWGSAAFADVRAVAPLKAMRAQFDRPDLSSARSSVPQFQYHEVYQPPETKKPVARAFRTKNPIKIDGQLNDEGWPLLAPERYLPLVSLRTKPDKTFPPAGKAAILFDDENLYVGFHVPCPELSKLKKTGGDWGTDDGVEVDFCALVKKKPGPIFVLHGFPSGAFESVTDAGASAEQAARLGAGLEYRCVLGDGEWTAEFRIPFKALGVSLADLDYMRFNVGARRNGIEGDPWFAWERTGGANYDVDSGGLLLFHPEVMAESKNLLTNGSFESSKIAAWRLSSNSRKPIPTETAVRVREGRDGSWCIRLESDDEETMKERVFKWTHPFAAALDPGSYHLSYDVRVQQLTPQGKMGSFNSYIHARRNNKPGGNIGQTESMFEAAEMDWTRRDFILVLPTGAEGSMVSLQLHRATGTVWIDNVSLLRCSKH